MRRVTAILGVAAVVLMAAGLTAQTKPSFAGQWTRDVQLGQDVLPEVDLTITQGDTAMAEWGASAERKTREPLFRKRVSTDRGELTFTSVTELDAEHRLLLISERHELVGRGDACVSDYQFVMRCREREELNMLFARHGSRNIQYFGAYDHGVELGATDRLVAVAQLSDNPDKP